MTNDAFIKMIADELKTFDNINAALKTVILAQAIRESGFGTSAICKKAKNNYFGINWYGDSYTCSYDYITSETAQERNGTLVKTTEKFCYFNSLHDAITCLIKWYDRPKYTGIKQLTDTAKITKMLVGKYATDSKYNTALDNLIKTLNLGTYFAESTTEIYIGSYEVLSNAKAQATVLTEKYGVTFKPKSRKINGKTFYRVTANVTKSQLAKITERWCNYD